MASRQRDWITQAEYDLAHARHALEDGDFEWACFASQQAAEKAIKAVYQSIGAQVIVGHGLRDMLTGLGRDMNVPRSLLEAGRVLDRHYIPARCPDAYASDAPHEHYSKREASQAVRLADKIVRFCQSHLS